MKKVIAICLSLILAGAALTVIGMATGADQSISLSRGGFLSMAKDAKTIEENDLKEFSDLAVSAGSGEIRIVGGDHYGYRLENVKEGQYIIENTENGGLRIDVKNEDGVALFPLYELFGGRGVKILVTVPKDVSVNVTAAVASGDLYVQNVGGDDMVLSTASGKIDIRTARAHNAVISCASGRVEMDGVTADDRMSISVGSGSVKATMLDVNNLTAEAMSGGMELSGNMTGDTEIRLGSGSATLDIDLPIHDFRCDFSVGSGDVFVNGKRIEGVDTNSAAQNSLSANVGSGTLRVNFAE